MVENNAVGTWEPGQNQKSDERLVFSCDPMGVDRTKPEQERTSKCEAYENARCPDARRDHAGMPNKRLAQSKLVRMVLNKGEALA